MDASVWPSSSSEWLAPDRLLYQTGPFCVSYRYQTGVSSLEVLETS
jgi:hypothetical protein